ncbi:protoporphyrinogen oxidase [Anoxybacillus flavithermus]|nr:protoporphyrinogen oxidase [Anoxybacillus flavithermus]
MKKKVVIIGGGMTGLAAAYYLQKEAREKQLPISCELIEASHRLGGKVQTVYRDGFVIERGPDSFLARKMSASRLIHEVGLEKELVHNTAGQSYILVNRTLHPIPGGAVMGIPTKLAPFVMTRLFSPFGKLRAAADFVLPPLKTEGDVSLGQFFRRRLGNEVVDRLIEPLLSGIYAGDIDELSLMATFPQYFHLEQKHGSLVLGMKRSMPKQKTKQKSDKGIFQTLKTGLASLVDAIEQRLEKGTVHKGVRVERIEKVEERYVLTLSNGEKKEADSVVVAVPHQSLPSLFPNETTFSLFETMPSTSVATVALAFPKEAVAKDMNGTGFVVSRDSDYTITACTWTHKKWPHTTPEGYVLLRCYVGRPGDEAIVDQTDEDIVQVVMDDLNKVMNITMNPMFSIVTRWKQSMPQYTVGHRERMERVKQYMQQHLPGIFLAGSSYEGLGLPDCIDQGEEAVKKVLHYLAYTKEKVSL